MNKVKQYLSKIDSISGKQNKVKYAKELFDYLLINSWFLKQEQKFAKTVKAKLDEFLNDKDPDVANEFKEYKHMF